jgi:hypothetical protein
MGNTGIRRDSKHRILCKGESIRANGKYQFKYHVDGKPHFVYSWRLEPTDPQPAGKVPCRSLREKVVLNQDATGWKGSKHNQDRTWCSSPGIPNGG